MNDRLATQLQETGRIPVNGLSLAELVEMVANLGFNFREGYIGFEKGDLIALNSPKFTVGDIEQRSHPLDRGPTYMAAEIQRNGAQWQYRLLSSEDGTFGGFVAERYLEKAVTDAA